MHRVAILFAGLVATAPLGAQPTAKPAAQRHTDFTGTWALDLSRLEAQEATHTGKSSLKITQDATTLREWSTAMQMNREMISSATFHLDSTWRDTVTQSGARVERALSSRWDGPVLVLKIETKTEGAPGPQDVTHRYSVDGAGAVLTINSIVHWNGQEIETAHFYTKAPPAL